MGEQLKIVYFLWLLPNQVPKYNQIVIIWVSIYWTKYSGTVLISSCLSKVKSFKNNFIYEEVYFRILLTSLKQWEIIKLFWSLFLKIQDLYLKDIFSAAVSTKLTIWSNFYFQQNFVHLPWIVNTWHHINILLDSKNWLSLACKKEFPMKLFNNHVSQYFLSLKQI